MEITTKDFWEKYWGEIKLPQKINTNFKNDRVISETIAEYVPKAKNNEIALEIGCAPGKWLVFLYERLGYRVDGFEYLDVAAEKTRENLSLCGITTNEYNIITADFLNQTPEEKYDLVTSFGFIEHFENYQDIFSKHLAYTKKDGYVVIGFPSFRGVNYYIQLCIDKISGSKIIENHNIKMMDNDLMFKMINQSKNDIVFSNYIGGFEPSLFNIQDIKNTFVRFCFKVVLKLLGFNNSNNKFVSSYLLVIVKKR